jgi:hypothetical protein
MPARTNLARLQEITGKLAERTSQLDEVLAFISSIVTIGNQDGTIERVSESLLEAPGLRAARGRGARSGTTSSTPTTRGK